MRHCSKVRVNSNVEEMPESTDHGVMRRVTSATCRRGVSVSLHSINSRTMSMLYGLIPRPTSLDFDVF